MCTRTCTQRRYRWWCGKRQNRRTLVRRALAPARCHGQGESLSSVPFASAPRRTRCMPTGGDTKRLATGGQDRPYTACERSRVPTSSRPKSQQEVSSSLHWGASPPPRRRSRLRVVSGSMSLSVLRLPQGVQCGSPESSCQAFAETYRCWSQAMAARLSGSTLEARVHLVPNPRSRTS